uniref:Deoxyribodipyrimidine photo-lyase n=1 Tax=Palpitomonas bilix TaxID=652834 RepID=A0A7S3DDL9_9EUKA
MAVEEEKSMDFEGKKKEKIVEVNEKYDAPHVSDVCHPDRVKELHKGKRPAPGPVVYWMSRDQRVEDNWALIYAQQRALEFGAPLAVAFNLVPSFLGATIRQFGFMLRGLEEVETQLNELGIPFYLLKGDSTKNIPTLVEKYGVALLVTDFSPLRPSREWKGKTVEKIKSKSPNTTVAEVDAHNVVPVWRTSEKLEYAARTIRRKVMDQLPEFLTEFPPVKKQEDAGVFNDTEAIKWNELRKWIKVDHTVKEVTWIKPGAKAAAEILDKFCTQKLKVYADARNDPTKDALSNLSPYLHFGQISAQRCAIEVKRNGKRSSASREGSNAFIEEAVVRRELSDNFVYYNKNYDNLKGAYDWARNTLNDHRNDKREYIYSFEQLEKGETHDDLWNAAQHEMVYKGKQHGFLRMYWAKKILEWTESPEQALEYAIALNDKYELDGRDPNGYVGCMWSICGIHDQVCTSCQAIFSHSATGASIDTISYYSSNTAGLGREACIR